MEVIGQVEEIQADLAEGLEVSEVVFQEEAVPPAAGSIGLALTS